MRKKSPYIRTSSFLNMAVRGGLTRFARPFGAARSLRARSVQLAAPVVEPRSGVLIPPVGWLYVKKSPYIRTSSFLNMAVRGGLTRCARPSGSPFAARPVCPTGCASCRTPVGCSHPPCRVALCEKSPYIRTSSFLNMAVRGGLTRFARPFGAARSLRARSVQLAAPVVEPRSVVLIPPWFGGYI